MWRHVSNVPEILGTLETWRHRGCHPKGTKVEPCRIIDLFPPTKRDPKGTHKAIWDEFQEEELELPPDKPLTLVSYDAGLDQDRVAYVEFVAVGDAFPDMPLFLKSEVYVPAPLEETYQTTWNVFPAPMKRLLETPS